MGNKFLIPLLFGAIFIILVLGLITNPGVLLGPKNSLTLYLNRFRSEKVSVESQVSNYRLIIASRDSLSSLVKELGIFESNAAHLATVDGEEVPAMTAEHLTITLVNSLDRFTNVEENQKKEKTSGVYVFASPGNRTVHIRVWAPIDPSDLFTASDAISRQVLYGLFFVKATRQQEPISTIEESIRQQVIALNGKNLYPIISVEAQ